MTSTTLVPGALVGTGDAVVSSSHGAPAHPEGSRALDQRTEAQTASVGDEGPTGLPCWGAWVRVDEVQAEGAVSVKSRCTGGGQGRHGAQQARRALRGDGTTAPEGQRQVTLTRPDSAPCPSPPTFTVALWLVTTWRPSWSLLVKRPTAGQHGSATASHTHCQSWATRTCEAVPLGNI